MCAGFRVLPSFAVLFGHALMAEVTAMPGLRFDPMALLHGEQEVYLPGALPTSATVVTRGQVTNVFDKGKGAAVVFQAVSSDLHTGTTLAVNRSTLFIRGIGGFGGDRGAAGPDVAAKWATVPPHAVFHVATTPNQVRALPSAPLRPTPAGGRPGGPTRAWGGGGGGGGQRMSPTPTSPAGAHSGFTASGPIAPGAVTRGALGPISPAPHAGSWPERQGVPASLFRLVGVRACAGTVVPPERRHQSAARRPRYGGGGRIRQAHPAWPVHLRHRGWAKRKRNGE
jgi:hypothetical protein